MKLSRIQINSFQKSLLDFYAQNQSDKPWKQDKNAYKIWVFEVVMQQTRMEQGFPYYERIIKKFPTVHSLAHSPEDELFSVWKGLGYYSRARNLQFTAKYIVNELNGVVPRTYLEWLKMKGVGEYTAAAIASFAYDEEVAVLDGNVHRLLSRVFGINKTIQSSADKTYFQTIANQLLIKGKSAIYNQAMMDMGSYVCKPQNPNCVECAFSLNCIAYSQDKISYFPPKKKRIELKERYFHCLFVSLGDKIYLEKRNEKDIWKGLYQGILQEGQEIDLDFWETKNINPLKISWSEWQTQLLSHQKIKIKIGRIAVKKTLLDTTNFIEYTSLKNYAMPRVLSKWWEETMH